MSSVGHSWPKLPKGDSLLARIPPKRLSVLRPECAQDIDLKHFLSANRIPLCGKMLYGDIMRTADIITEKLSSAFSPESLRVDDESHLHEGHAGHRQGGQTHFRLYIVADAFVGKTRIDRHRMINAALAEELAGSVHALAIHATAPGEDSR